MNNIQNLINDQNSQKDHALKYDNPYGIELPAHMQQIPFKDSYHEQVFLAVMNGFLGDQIASLPLLKWLKEDIKIDLRVICQSKLKFLYTETYIFSEQETHDMEKPLTIFDIPNILVPGSLKPKEPHMLYQFDPNGAEVVRSHIIDYMSFNWFGTFMPYDKRSQPKIKEQNITEKIIWLLDSRNMKVEDLQKSVLIGVSSRTRSKRWNPNVLCDFVSWLNKNGYHVIFIGNDDRKIDLHKKEYAVSPAYESTLVFDEMDENKRKNILQNDLNLDLTSKLELRETIALMQKAKCLVTMEGGINHIAMLTDIPVIVGYSLVNPKSRVFWRNGIFSWRTYPVYVNRGCKFCLTDFFITNWEFDQCYQYFFSEKRERFSCCNIPLEAWISSFEKCFSDLS